MNWKSFIIASVIIHFVGGIALYFYYNPIQLKPKPLSQKEKKFDEEPIKNDLSPETKKAFQQLKNKKRIAIPPALKASKDLSRPTLKKEPIHSEISEEMKLNPVTENKKEKSKEDIQDFFQLKQKPGNPPLSYPDFARRRGMQGNISLLFFLDERGLVEKIQLEDSTGHADLDNFVLRTLSRYQFEENQEGRVRYKNSFVLEGKEQEHLRLRQEEQEELLKGETEGKPVPVTKGLNPQSTGKEPSDNLKDIESKEMEIIDYESLEEANFVPENPTEKEEKSAGDEE